MPTRPNWQNNQNLVIVDNFVQSIGRNVQNIVHICSMENEELDDKKSRIRIRISINYDDAITLGVFCRINQVLGVTLRILDADEQHGYADVEFNFRSDTRQNFNKTIIHFFLAYAEYRATFQNKKP